LSLFAQWEVMAFLLPGVLVAIPCGGLCLFLLRSNHTSRLNHKLRRYIVFSKIWLTFGWLVSVFPGLIWGSLWLSLYDPWPFSLAQGPDTDHAGQGFNRIMGFQPDTKFTNMFYKGYGFRDSEEYLRFDCSDAAAVETFISDRKLHRMTESSEASQNIGVAVARLSWWLDADTSRTMERWKGPLAKLWFDRRNCRVYIYVFTM